MFYEIWSVKGTCSPCVPAALCLKGPLGGRSLVRGRGGMGHGAWGMSWPPELSSTFLPPTLCAPRCLLHLLGEQWVAGAVWSDPSRQDPHGCIFEITFQAMTLISFGKPAQSSS